MSASPNRIGLFGGTFDPVHYGHLRPAIELAERFALDVLYLLPNFRPAHRGPTGASSAERIAMLEAAVSGVARLEIDTREADRAGPTYTIETLEQLRDEHPAATLLFFLGMDAFARFDRWRRWEAILEHCHLVVMDRPGAVLSKPAAEILSRQQARRGVSIASADTGDEHLDESRADTQTDAGTVAGAGVIERVSVTQLDIPATAIRTAVENGRSIRFLLPETTREYIEDNGLYRSGG